MKNGLAKHGLRPREGRKFFSEDFALAIRRFGIQTTAFKVGINKNQMARWVGKEQRATSQDERFVEIAKMVGFEGEMFE